jgi:hypothetical protein
MPSHGVMPYRLGLREKGDTDNFHNLTKLQLADDTLDFPTIFDYFEDFLNHYSGGLDTNSEKQKTFAVEDFHIDRNANVVEGLVTTGDYGYTAELKDVNTGSTTHQKDIDEAEVIPYYFIFHLPKTKSDKLYDKGHKGIMVFQRFNGRSFKTAFTSRFLKRYVKADTQAEETKLEMRPVTTQAVLEKVIDASRVTEAEFDVEKVPQTNDKQVQLIEGLDSADSERQSIVWKPKWGGSLIGLQKKAKQLQKKDGSFAEVVEDPVEDLTVTIENKDGRAESFSLLEDELKMNKNLDPDQGHLKGGHPKPEYVSSEAQKMVNQVIPSTLTKDLNYNTRI